MMWIWLSLLLARNGDYLVPRGAEVRVPFRQEQIKISSKMLDRSEILSFLKSNQNTLSYEHYAWNQFAIPELEKSLVDALPSRLLKSRAKKYIVPTLIVAGELGVDPFYVLSIMWAESSFNQEATSVVGAKGLMQIMPATKIYLKNKFNKKMFKYLSKKIKNVSRLNDNTIENIILGTFYIKYLKNKFNDPIHVAAAYNMGPGWANKRISQGKKIGNKNRYVSKVKDRYKVLISKVLVY